MVSHDSNRPVHEPSVLEQVFLMAMLGLLALVVMIVTAALV